jgi:Fis family transcriptional regulator, factor for inversion stimulation protein
MKNEFDGLVEHLLRGNIFMQEAIELLEKKMIEGALRESDGNQSIASKQLGIHRNTLLRKIRDYELCNGRSHHRAKPVASEGRTRRRKSA